VARKDILKAIESGKTVLGIEFGSTRIKAVLIGEDHAPIASGSHDWENRYENGIWTYSINDIWTGLQDSYLKLSSEVVEKHSTSLKTIGAIGFSGMMHGYMAFDKSGNLLVPFRTWRNTMTEQASKELTDLFRFNIPEHCTPPPGDNEQGTPCRGHHPSDHAGRLCPLEADGTKGAGCWRSLGHVPH
jgi:sugar (pentulose or hexulose) kinase